MTKADYIKKHPKSTLAARLLCTDWPDNTPIQIVGGLDAPYNKTSNLYGALAASKSKAYVKGGHRMRGTEGWWWAIRRD